VKLGSRRVGRKAARFSREKQGLEHRRDRARVRDSAILLAEEDRRRTKPLRGGFWVMKRQA
jgi:hypothetical protein